MRYIFINCIANGQIDWKTPLTAAHQPSIRECFMIVAGEIQNGFGHKDFDLLDEQAGPSATMLSRYAELIPYGDVIVVGHSVEYHHGHLRAAMIPNGLDPCDGRVKTICSMLSLTGHVTKRNGKKGWPTFDEACDFFQITRAGVETAADNARCLFQIFIGMQAIGAVPDEPKIWKDRWG